MLCYHSSRKTADVLRDTFAWLVMNRAALLSIAIPITVFSILFVAFYYNKIDRVIDITNPYQALYPFNISIEKESYLSGISPSMVILYSGLTFFATLMLVPMLIRYFVDRRSLLKMNVFKAFSLLREHMGRALAAAVILSLGCALIIVMPIPFFSIIFAVVLIIMIPRIIMKSMHPVWTYSEWLKIISSAALIIVIFCVVQAVPTFFFVIIEIALNMLSDVLPGYFYDIADNDAMLNALLTLLMCISYSAAVIVFIVASLMLHGIIHQPNYAE